MSMGLQLHLLLTANRTRPGDKAAAAAAAAGKQRGDSSSSDVGCASIARLRLGTKQVKGTSCKEAGRLRVCDPWGGGGRE
jgi:hypothetical protein